jgi:PAS domain-containing protein
MLADVLNDASDRLARELEHRAATMASLGEPPVSGQRRRRMRRLVQEVVETLRHGGVDDQGEPLTSPEPAPDQALLRGEREMLQRYLIREIEEKHLEASANETAIVAKWAAQIERRQLREQTQRLGALLDEVGESAAILEPDGRIVYCNLAALQRLREVSGAPRNEIIGRTLAELGISSEFLIGCSLEQLRRE